MPHPQKVPSLTEHLSPRGSIDVEADKRPTTHDSWQAMLRYDAARRRDSATSYGGAGQHIVGSPEVLSPRSEDEHLQQQQSSSVMMQKISKGQTSRASLHLGDDLPHMPEQLPSGFISPPPVSSHSPQLVGAGAGTGAGSRRDSFMSAGEATLRSAQAPKVSGNALDDAEKTVDDEDVYTSPPALYRQYTPPALKGSNAVLVDRELERLRDKKAKEIKMKWRIITGCLMLLLFGFSAYILVEYILAYLALSPANWFLSDAQDGTQTSPDPMLRSLALVGVAVQALAVAGIVLSGFYLRFSRRRSCGTYTVWIIAIVSTTLNVALSVANLSLIALWHKKYSDTPDDPLAKTRDVSQRCNGVWDMDLLWSAAKASPIAKPSDDGAAASACTHDARRTLLMFMIAGGLRLGILVFLCAVWMACLARYNRSLAIVGIVDPDMKESAEMQKLLMEEGGYPGPDHPVSTVVRSGGKHDALPAMPSEPRDSLVVPGSYEYEYDDERVTQVSDAHHQPKSYGGGGSVYDDETLRGSQSHFHSSQSRMSHEAPTLQHFAWQQNKVRDRHDEEIYTYGNMPHHRHERSGSAGAWSQGILDRLWTALWGESSPETHGPHQEQHMGDEKGTLLAAQQQQQQHQREDSRLGVGGWFRREPSDSNWRMQGSETDARDWKLREDSSLDIPNYQQEEAHAPAPPLPPKQEEEQRHQRTASQEKRSREARHAASSSQRHVNGAAEPGGLTSGSRSRSNSRERAERRRRDQQDRIAFLASLGYQSGEGGQTTQQEANAPQQRVGDDLPPMPMARGTAQREETSLHKAADGTGDEDDDEAFWRGPGPSTAGESDRNLVQPVNQPVFVRTLGKLVRKLSAIESVGSGEGRRSASGATSQHHHSGNHASSSSSHYRSGSRAGQRSFEGVAMAGREMGTVNENDW